MQHSDFGGLTESDWSRLSQEQRDDALRRHHLELVRRHLELRDGQKDIVSRQDREAVLIAAAASGVRELDEKVQDVSGKVDIVASALALNTGKTEEAIRATDAVKRDTQLVVQIATAIKGTKDTVEWLTVFGLKVGVIALSAWAVFGPPLRGVLRWLGTL